VTDPGPTINLVPAPETGNTIASCVCGQTYTAVRATAAAQWAELHSLRCPQWLTWAHERIDNLPYSLGHYLPAQVLDLLHQLANEPAAMVHIGPWLFGIEDRPDV
jgi:hypothetical protein